MSSKHSIRFDLQIEAYCWFTKKTDIWKNKTKYQLSLDDMLSCTTQEDF